MKLALTLLLALPALAFGDVLSDLRASLVRLENDETIRARLEIKTRKSNGESDKQKLSEGTSSVIVESGAQGLTLNWPLAQIQEWRAAAWEKSAHPDAAKLNSGTLTAIEASDVLNLLHAAEALRLVLENALLLEDKRDTYKGKVSRLLVIKLDLRLPEEGRKALKESEAILKLWLDAEGRPLGMARDLRLRFSKFFLSYRVREQDLRDYQVASGRLIVTHSKHDSTGSGLGHSEETHSSIEVTLLPNEKGSVPN